MNSTLSTKYPPLMIILHWLMVLLFIGVYATIENRGMFERGSDGRELIKYTHFVLGFSIFVLVWLRLLIRLKNPIPQIIPPLVSWQHYLSKLVHWLLYGLMVTMPILGWLIISAEGKTLDLGLFSLPNIMPTDKDLAHDLEEIHETIGKAGYFLIGFHALAALLHHYFFKDNTLRRMLPGKSH
ncbi:cytochrome b [Neptunicella sp. SCSIO 80796]|uniref:cytochrome b n=1 Tax=Neptunicella plasticusilytica TaxID=3117012 RepID=UPI003A4E04BE